MKKNNQVTCKVYSLQQKSTNAQGKTFDSYAYVIPSQAT